MKTVSPSRNEKMLTKTQDIHNQLFSMATALGPNAKMPTVQQLRRDLKVSITTLDSALTKLENEKVISRKQGSGIFVSPRLNQKCVGLVCEPAFFSAGTSPFWQQLVQGARGRAVENGEAFRFYLALRSSDGTSPLPDDLLEDIAARRIDGVLFLGNNEAAQAWLKQREVPTVVFAGKGEYSVELDVEQMVTVAGQHLLGVGCERIALLSHWESRIDPPYDFRDSRGIAALRALLEKAGQPFHAHLMWDAATVGNRVDSVPETHQEQGYQAVLNLFDGKQTPPDGLLCTDDMMTRGALAGLRRLGLEVGEEVQLVSHINRGSAVLQGEDDRIAFVEIDPAEIVATMFSQLEILMENKTPAQSCAAVKAHFKN